MRRVFVSEALNTKIMLSILLPAVLTVILLPVSQSGSSYPFRSTTGYRNLRAHLP